jgi:hypothetical protein
VSEDGNPASGFYLRYDLADNAWAFSRAASDTANASSIRAHSTSAPGTGDLDAPGALAARSPAPHQLAWIFGAIPGSEPRVSSGTWAPSCMPTEPILRPGRSLPQGAVAYWVGMTQLRNPSGSSASLCPHGVGHWAGPTANRAGCHIDGCVPSPDFPPSMGFLPVEHRHRHHRTAPPRHDRPGMAAADRGVLMPATPSASATPSTNAYHHAAQGIRASWR